MDAPETTSEQSGRANGPIEVIVARSDGDILRGGDGLSARQVDRLEMAVGLVTLLASSRETLPVWIDLDDDGQRLVAAGFNREFVFASFMGRKQARARFIRKARSLFEA